MSLIGKKIAAARKAKKITQAELADKIGLKQNTLSNIESGKNKYDIDTAFLVSIADALGDPSILVEKCRTCQIREKVDGQVLSDCGKKPDPIEALEKLKKQALGTAAKIQEIIDGGRTTQNISQELADLRALKAALDLLEKDMETFEAAA